MKKTIRFKLRMKGTDKVFKEGWDPGVVVMQDFTWDLKPSEYNRPMFAAQIIDKENEFIKEHIEVIVEEIERD